MTRIWLFQPRSCLEERVTTEGSKALGHVSGSNHILQEVCFAQREDPWCAPEPGQPQAEPGSPPPCSAVRAVHAETAVPLGQTSSSPTSKSTTPNSTAPLQSSDGRDSLHSSLMLSHLPGPPDELLHQQSKPGKACELLGSFAVGFQAAGTIIDRGQIDESNHTLKSADPFPLL